MVSILHQSITVGSAEIFYRETVPRNDASELLPILLLHGFPSSSHQYRGLMQAIGHEFGMMAPDYPGFGLTLITEDQAAAFEYSFDNLSDFIEAFIDRMKLDRFILYVFDFGGPIGFRIAMRRPELIAGLVVQNANAYHAGLSEGARYFAITDEGDPAGIKALEQLMSLEGIKSQYFTGVSDAEKIAPDGYTLDYHFLQEAERKAALMALLLDYTSNLASYPDWQDWMRGHLPPALVLWGRHDPLFPETGARFYLADLPHAELAFFEAGHFALEECLNEIAPLVADFSSRSVPQTGRG